MKRIVFFVTFFLYSGYYAILALLISFGISSSSRSITVPLRLLSTVLMLYVIVRLISKYKISQKKKWIYLCFGLFWSFYFLKVILNHLNHILLMRTWYEYIFYAFNFCVLPFFMYSLVDFEKYKKAILNSLVFSGFIMGLVSLYLYKDVFTLNIGRLNMLQYATGEETLSPLALSYAGSLTIVLCLYEILYNKFKTKKYKIYLYTTIVLSAIMFFLGASRGSVVAFVLSIPILFYYGTIKNKAHFILITIVSVPIVIWGALKTGSSIFERVSGTFQGEKRGSRFDLWEMAIDIFINNPVIGGNIEIVNAPGYEHTGNPNIYPHNFVLEILMATGIIGFMFFLLYFIPVIRKITSISDKKNIVYIYVILIQGFIQYSFSGALYFSILLFFPLGLIYSLNEK